MFCLLKLSLFYADLFVKAKKFFVTEILIYKNGRLRIQTTSPTWSWSLSYKSSHEVLEQ